MKKTLTLIISIILLGTAYSQPKIQYKNGKWAVDKKILFSEFSKQFNHLRDSFHLGNLGFGKTSDTIAWEHSRYMAETGEYGHGRGSIKYSEKISYILGRNTDIRMGENIIKLDGYDFSESLLKSIDRKGLEKSGGKTMVSLIFKEDLSYEDFVNEIIKVWLNSPAHRELLLSPSYKYFSIAAVSDNKNCFYITYECQM
jgi:uncharacterized protein YkwD